jgi:hypothetical protein
MRRAISRTTSSEALSRDTYRLGSPGPVNENPITGPVTRSLPFGPCNAGSAVTVTAAPDGPGRQSTTKVPARFRQHREASAGDRLETAGVSMDARRSCPRPVDGWSQFDHAELCEREGEGEPERPVDQVLRPVWATTSYDGSTTAIQAAGSGRAAINVSGNLLV